jgi:hypothetical protein
VCILRKGGEGRRGALGARWALARGVYYAVGPRCVVVGILGVDRYIYVLEGTCTTKEGTNERKSTGEGGDASSIVGIMKSFLLLFFSCCDHAPRKRKTTATHTGGWLFVARCIRAIRLDCTPSTRAATHPSSRNAWSHHTHNLALLSPPPPPNPTPARHWPCASLSMFFLLSFLDPRSCKR